MKYTVSSTESQEINKPVRSHRERWVVGVLEVNTAVFGKNVYILYGLEMSEKSRLLVLGASLLEPFKSFTIRSPVKSLTVLENPEHLI